ncbi:MAG: DEAD/DEAH box helicase [Clostridia bacterium]|nr:DEAD/DEAH box helicase [Clostridia bacterium]
MSFDHLNLLPILLKNIRGAGYQTPTPIQEATIPLVLAGKDVLGCAQTGTGKTASFALPILQRLTEVPSSRRDARVIRSLILSPTRELALQTWENFQIYGKGLPLQSCVIFGGVGQGAQVEALHRGADIVIACPGRLLDLMAQGFVRLDWVEIFVLDEADRMLDMGFIHDVRRVVRALPEKRQTLLFSATMPPEVEKLALDLLTEPEDVKVDPVTSTVDAIDQCLYYVDKGNKKHLLAHLLRSEDLENALVFARTRHGVDRIVRDLKRAGIYAEGIHGDKSQNARQNALKRFKTGECRVLVATDIAARGIDVAGLSHVINYDQPMEPEAYIHRIGRTGRAGRTGKAISFCCIDEVKQLNQVEKLIGKRLREEKSDWPMEITTPSEPRPRPPRPARVSPSGEAVALRKRSAGPGTAGTGRPVQRVRRGSAGNGRGR